MGFLDGVRSLGESAIDKVNDLKLDAEIKMIEWGVDDKVSKIKDNVSDKVSDLNFDVKLKKKDIKETYSGLESETEKRLQSKEDMKKSIFEAIENQNYSWFTDNPTLKFIKDSWGMTPLMHFIVRRDLEGVRLLADTYNPDERNNLGHTVLNLICMEHEDEFVEKALISLDVKLSKMLKELKSKGNRNKLGDLFLKGVDLINLNTVGSIEVIELTSDMESAMIASINNLKNEINSYIEKIIAKNRNEYLKYLFNPIDFNVELSDYLKRKEHIEKELECIYNLTSRYAINPFTAPNTKLERALNEVMYIEVGEKDEFETTNDFLARKKAKLEEIKLNYLQYSQVSTCVEELMKETNDKKDKKNEELNILEKNIKETKFRLNVDSFNVKSILRCYYQPYEKLIELGAYDADEETIITKVNKTEKKVTVPRRIAKDFKLNFNDLKPDYNADIQKNTIHHSFFYKIAGEQVKFEFLVSTQK